MEKKDNYEFLKIIPEVWKRDYEHNARLSVFGEITEADKARIDYALLCVYQRELCIYATVREFHADHAYLCFGGSFPNVRGNTQVVREAFLSLIDWLFSNGYDQITFHTKNTNYKMQRLSMHAGFVCVGTSTTPKHILLEYNLVKGE